MSKVSASSPELGEGLQYHIRCKPGDVAPYVLLPGDPDRVPLISSFWDDKREIARHREYVTHTGVYKGAPISSTSTGIGGPAASIALEELLRVGANTFIRVGTTGALRREIRVGDLIIATGAVRLDGASEEYVRIEYPALAHYEVVLALVEAAEQLGFRYHVGIVASTDTFYTGQARPGFKGYMPSWSKEIMSDLQEAGVLSFEMEAASIFTLASIYGARAGAVLAVLANRVTDEFGLEAGVKEAVQVANEAVKILYEWDSRKAAKNKRNIYPSLLFGKT
ncbi:MAG: uridine phosphorylase [Infirmifilum sp.]|jgi:uridine phosphorylase